MKDRPDAPEPQPDNAGDLRAPTESSPTARFGKLGWYAFLFIIFTEAGAIMVVLHEALTAAGSPLETIHSIILNMWRAAEVGLALTVTVVLVSKTISFVSRCWRKLPFKPPQRKPRQ